MTIFIADFILGNRKRRARSRPSPAARLIAQLRPSRRIEGETIPSEAPAPRIDTGPILTRRADAVEDDRPSLRP
jgi:hypothetical protein